MFVAALLWRLLTFSGFNNDHYAHLALAQQMLSGDRPVRDFLDPGWPLTYLLSAAAWRAAGDAMVVEWTITATAFAFGAAFTVVAAHRLSGSIAIAVLVALFEVLIYPRTYAYPKILAYAAFAAVITASGVPARRRLVTLGLLVAGAFLLRHDHGVWLGFASLVYLALASWGEGVRAVLQRGAIVAGVALAVLLPWLLYLALSGGVIPYFETAIEYARSEANASMLDAWPWFGMGADADAWLFWLFWSLPLASAALVAHRWRRGDERWPGELAAVVAFVVLAAGLNAGFLRDVLRTRLPDASVPAAILGAWLLGEAWIRARPARRLAPRLVQLAAAVLVAVSAVAMSQVAELPERFERSNIGSGPAAVYDRYLQVSRLLSLPHRQDEAPPSRFAAILMPFFAYLDRCTDVTERLIVTGASPDIVVLAGRPFAGDGVTFGQWYSSAANQPRTLERLRARRALFVIVLDDEGFRQRFPVIAGYVQEEYQAFTEARDDAVSLPILVERRRVPQGVDAETQWPCFRQAGRGSDPRSGTPGIMGD